MMGQKSDTKSLSVSTTAIQLLPLRPEREVAYIFNASQGIVYWRLGLNVTDALFTGRLQQNEMSPPIYKYNGPITAIRTSGTSTVLVTECW